MKKQRTFWMDDADWKILMQKVDEQFQGKGKLERFLERVAREAIIFLPKSVKISIEALPTSKRQP